MGDMPAAGYAALCTKCPLALICIGNSVDTIQQCRRCGEVRLSWKSGGYWVETNSYPTFTCPCARQIVHSVLCTGGDIDGQFRQRFCKD